MAGAPRSNHTGQVVVYTLKDQSQPNILDSQRGDQVMLFILYQCPSVKERFCIHLKHLIDANRNHNVNQVGFGLDCR